MQKKSKLFYNSSIRRDGIKTDLIQAKLKRMKSIYTNPIFALGTYRSDLKPHANVNIRSNIGSSGKM